VSLFISLTTTPMMCARLLRAHDEKRHGLLYRMSERGFNRILAGYEHSLSWVLRHRRLTFLATLATIGITVYLYVIIPKGFFPQQDTGRLTGSIQADQATSFQAMHTRVLQVVNIIMQDPDVESLIAFTGGGGGGTLNTGRMFITLRPERKLSADQVIARLRPKLLPIPGSSVYLQSVQDLRIGGRPSPSQYQFTLQSDSVRELNQWAPLVLQKMRTLRQLVDVNTDQQDRGLQASLVIDRNTAARLGSHRKQSMTRFMTPSDSAWSLQYTRSSTSITWSWRRSRDSGRTRTDSNTSMYGPGAGCRCL